MTSAGEAVRRLRQDVQDFWAPLHGVARVDASELSPLRFYREFVSKNVPVVLTNAMQSPQWLRARENWQDDAYLVKKAGDASVTVDVTPFGLGDAVLEFDGEPGEEDALFVMPEEREMTLREFLDVLADRDGFDGVPYLSHQVRRQISCVVGYLAHCCSDWVAVCMGVVLAYRTTVCGTSSRRCTRTCRRSWSWPRRPSATSRTPSTFGSATSAPCPVCTRTTTRYLHASRLKSYVRFWQLT